MTEPGNEPLNEQELERLQGWLVENMERGGMPLDVAHGFLAAVVSGPDDIQPQSWLPVLLGQPEFPDDETAEEITALLFRLHNEVIDELEAGRFGPMVIYKPVEDGEPLPLPYGWCEGYTYGFRMHGDDAVERVEQDDHAVAHLTPILSFMMYEEHQLLDPPNEVEHRKAAAELGHAAIALFHWWAHEGHDHDDGPRNGVEVKFFQP